ncbi:hypothetical protein CRUP_015882, partial [Coryphaenoides rupestris]
IRMIRQPRPVASRLGIQPPCRGSAPFLWLTLPAFRREQVNGELLWHQVPPGQTEVLCVVRKADSSQVPLLVRLQLASGAFLLTETYSDCIQIPLDRLKRASPYSLHRRSLCPPFRCTCPSTSKPLSHPHMCITTAASITLPRPP